MNSSAQTKILWMRTASGYFTDSSNLALEMLALLAATLLISFGPKEFRLQCDTSCESLMKDMRLTESGLQHAGPAGILESKSETSFRFW